VAERAEQGNSGEVRERALVSLDGFLGEGL
jgi:hypothetical protein